MPYWVGICGGSASGKTYLLELLRRHLPPDKVTFLSTDHYYRDLAHQPRDPEGRVNFDHPEAIDHEKLYHDLLELRAGRSVSQREYTFNRPGATPRLLTFAPAPVLIAEGLFLFYWAPIRELFDLRIFMEAPEPYRFIRRLQRDQTERGYTPDSITHQYLTQVLPAYEQFIAPLRRFAHVIIQNDYGDITPALKVVLSHLQEVVRKS
ncbi:MAG: uridine-cytidine kinase [Bacteroidia bacterium]|nr:uridine-cytidine kinase [Bacteroidia bacterium]MCX7763610.1 uridine-cytidine kinase [Bacteroidia bacterium]MDW8057508.1 uridine-cytidine kinase [Bacteroidia bacterium]